MMAAAGWKPSDLEDLFPLTARPKDITDDFAPDIVPTIDQAGEDTPPPASYRDWVPGQTRVIVYTTRPDKYPQDRVVDNRVEAMARCRSEFGRVLEANYLPERFFFRVKRG